MTNLNLTIGCDPEIFLSLGKRYISAYGLFPGTKYEPYKVDKGAIQVDGTALEFNIDPAKTPEEFTSNISIVLKQLREIVRKVDKDIQLVFKPYIEFDVQYFRTLHPESKELGCDPDFQYTGKQNIIKKNLISVNARTASGHIHLGWTNGEDPGGKIHFEDCRYLSDYFYRERNEYSTAIPDVLKLMGNEEYHRINWYGGYGAFRPKPYGVELRQYSNRWVEKEENYPLVFNYFKDHMEKLWKGNI